MPLTVRELVKMQLFDDLVKVSLGYWNSSSHCLSSTPFLYFILLPLHHYSLWKTFAPSKKMPAGCLAKRLRPAPPTHISWLCTVWPVPSPSAMSALSGLKSTKVTISNHAMKCTKNISWPSSLRWGNLCDCCHDNHHMHITYITAAV